MRRRRPLEGLWVPLLIATGVGYIVGLALDLYGLYFHRFSFGVHVAVQLPACFIGLFAGAWWMDRRRPVGPGSAKE